MHSDRETSVVLVVDFSECFVQDKRVSCPDEPNHDLDQNGIILAGDPDVEVPVSVAGFHEDNNPNQGALGTPIHQANDPPTRLIAPV